VRPIPAWLRPEAAPGELESSYLNRLAQTFGATVPFLQRVARSCGMTVVEYAEAKAELRPGSLVPDTTMVDGLAGRRFLCQVCTDGVVIEVAPHVDFYCCTEHAAWVGPRLQPPRPGEVEVVARLVVDADGVYRRMREAGSATSSVLAEAAWVVGDLGAPARSPAHIDQGNYAEIVIVLQLLVDRGLGAELNDPQMSSPQRFAIARGAIERHLDRPPPLVSSRFAAAVVGAVRAPSAADAPRHLPVSRMASRNPVAHDDTSPRTATRHRALLAHASFAKVSPEAAAEWHPTRNGDVTPEDITSSSNTQRYWWRCKKCHHEWMTTPTSRTNGHGCPACSGRVATPTNCLRAIAPDIASEWDYAANVGLTPDDVTAGSGKLVGWICPRGHHYPAIVNARTLSGNGCTICTNRVVVPGVNDLGTLRPDIAASWHPTANGPLTPQHISIGSSMRVYWWCEEHEYEWVAKVSSRTHDGRGCPVCGGRVVLPGVNDLATLLPDVAQYWVSGDDDLAPSSVSPGSGRVATWKCINGLPHTFRRVIGQRVRHPSCPVCRGYVVLPGFNDLATRHPELVAEWHPTLNNTAPDQVVPGNTRWWWRCHRGHITRTTVRHRLLTGGCSQCPPAQRLLAIGDSATTR